jgi:hypothetical protein
MKKLFISIAAIFLLAFVGGSPDDFGKRDWTSIDTALTGTAPTSVTSATAGLDAANLLSFFIIVTSDTGQTLSGAGQIDIYFYDSSLKWFQGSQSFSIPSRCAGKTICVSDSYSVPPRGRVMGVSNGITVSSGGVTVRLLGTYSRQSTSQ